MKVNGVEVDVHDYDSFSGLTHMKTNKRVSSYDARMQEHQVQTKEKKPVNIGKLIFWLIVLISFGPQLLMLVFGILVSLIAVIFGM